MKIGVVLPIGEDDELGRPYAWTEIRALALAAEGAGFDSLWLPDHLLFRLPEQEPFGIWEGWTILSALAEATTRVELGPLVICVPFRNPALLATMAVTLDEVSGGRLTLGLGAGWHEPEFAAFGVPFDHRVDRFEEGLRIIAPLLRQGRVDYRGVHASAPGCELRPRGPRPGGPPLLIAARGPRMLRLTARWADAWNWAWSGDPTRFVERYAELRAACDAIGRDPATLAVTVGINVVYPHHAREPLPARYHDPAFALLGSPAEIAAGLRAWDDQPVAHLICNPIPNTPATHRELAEALRLLRAR